MRSFRGFWRAVVAATLLIGGAAAPGAVATAGPAAAAAASWRVMTTPNVGANSRLLDIACPTVNDCIAVGTAGTARALVLHWNGTVWAAETTPAVAGGVVATLVSVACTGAQACIGVGSTLNSSTQDSHTLAERWNGSAWSVQTSPSPTGPGGAVLVSVSCPAPTSCFAVGASHDNALALHWNGSSWSTQKFPSDRADATNYNLFDITCRSATWCEAVGDITSTVSGTSLLAARWNGTAWSVDDTPAPPVHEKSGQFNSVACTSTTSCIAVGSTFDFDTNTIGQVLERWNGHTWSIVVTPTPKHADYASFGGISCLSASSCVVVGATYTAGPTDRELVDRSNGTTWTLDASPGRGPLLSVSCNAPSTCTAVGGGVGSALIERSP